MVMSKKAKVLISLIVSVGVLTAAPFVIYLKVLPYAVSCPKFISYVEKTVNKYLDLDICIIHPELKTSLSPVIEFKVDEFQINKRVQVC